MQAAFQWRFPGLFLHIFLYTFFYFHAASDPAHLLSQHFGCYCCPAFSLASPFISLFSLLSYLWRFPPAHLLSQHSGCHYCPCFLLATPFVFPFFSYLTLLTCSSSITTLRLPLLPDYLSTFSISLFSLLSYLWRFPPAHFLSQLSGWLLCPISFSTFHLLFSALHLLIFYTNHWFGYTVSLVSLVPSLPLLLSTGSLFIPTLVLVVVTVSVLSHGRFKRSVVLYNG